jgi:hypothetical protein
MDPFSEFILQFLGEFILQGCFELLARAGYRTLSDPFRAERKAWLSALGHIAWGLIAGAISLLVFPSSFIQSQTLKLVNLFGTPVALGLSMMAIAHFRRNEKADAPLDHFGYAFLFAISMALVRYVGTN